jgi:hypothetical protein
MRTLPPAPLVAAKTSDSVLGLEGYRLYRLWKNSVLYQGTTFVVRQMIENRSDFSP